MIQLSVPVAPGNSGAPLFNMHGEVIGVTTEAAAGGPPGRVRIPNLAIPVNALRPMVRSEYPQRRRFGGSAA